MGDIGKWTDYAVPGSGNLLGNKDHTPAPPKPRSLLDEAQESMDVWKVIGPQQADLVSSMLGKYGMTEGDLSRNLNTEQRTADVNDLANLGPAAVAAIQAANPQQQRLLNSLNNQASSELDQGATLDPSLRREVQQGVRSGQAARGMGYGPSDLYEEAMATGSAGQNLRNQRRQFAGSVASLDQASNVDPSLAVLGRPSTAFGATNQRTPSYDPMNSYSQDLNNTNYNAAWSNVFSVRNYNAAINSAMIGAIGSIIGGAGGAAVACWVAREVFGPMDPRWILFREWLMTRAPNWFRDFYLKHGQALAAWLRYHPTMKAFVRRWMLARIGSIP